MRGLIVLSPKRVDGFFLLLYQNSGRNKSGRRDEDRFERPTNPTTPAAVAYSFSSSPIGTKQIIMVKIPAAVWWMTRRIGSPNNSFRLSLVFLSKRDGSFLVDSYHH
jgi:hypothetical protein